MLGLAIGVLAIIVLGALFRSALAVAAAYALTTLVALPGILDVLAWVAAGGYVVLNVVGAFVAIAALLNASR